MELKTTNGTVLFANTGADKVAPIRAAFVLVANAIHNKVDLDYADFSGMDLRSLSFRGVRAFKPFFRGARLDNCEFQGSFMAYGDFAQASCAHTNFNGASLHGSQFNGANLTYARFAGATLDDVNWDNAAGLDIAMAHLSIFPEEGDFIAFKKAISEDYRYPYVLVKLLIPGEAQKTCGQYRKCRASKAQVVSMTYIENDKDTGIMATAAHAHWVSNFMYRPGEWVTPREPYNRNPREECASGIHFFMTKGEAIRYHF